jgi:hypothetical protein
MFTDILALLAPYAVLVAGEALVVYARRKRRRRQAVKPATFVGARATTVTAGWQQPTVKLSLTDQLPAPIASPLRTTARGTVTISG